MTTKNKAIASLVCGIVALVGGWVFNLIPVVGWILTLVLGIVLPIVGIVFGAQVLKTKPEGSEKGMAVAGLVLGIIGCAWNVIGLLCLLCAGALIAGAAASGQLK